MDGVFWMKTQLQAQRGVQEDRACVEWTTCPPPHVWFVKDVTNGF